MTTMPAQHATTSGEKPPLGSPETDSEARERTLAAKAFVLLADGHNAAAIGRSLGIDVGTAAKLAAAEERRRRHAALDKNRCGNPHCRARHRLDGLRGPDEQPPCRKPVSQS